MTHTETGTDGETGLETGPDSGMSGGTGDGPEAGADCGTGGGTGDGTGPEAAAGCETDSSTGGGTGGGTGTDAGTRTDAGTGDETGSRTGTDARTGTGTGTGIGRGTGTEAGTGTRIGRGTGTEAGTGTRIGGGFVVGTRVFYDAIAEDYAAMFAGYLGATPLDRAVLGAYAELVGGEGAVADLGCGPGRVTAHLASLGLRVFGLDLSESMLAIARREHPGLRFEQGSMLDLDIPDGSLAGVVSWYSTIHTPADRLPDVFAEFHRVLAPGGHLLVGFQVGDRPRHHDRPFGHDVSLDFLRRRPDDVTELLRRAGFALHSQTVREPADALGESTPQAFLLARKPATAAPGAAPAPA